MKKTIFAAMMKLFEDNPPGIAASIIAERIWRRVHSAFMSVSLCAPGLSLGPGCSILGGHRISFGRGIRAGRNLWLEAVTSYDSQHFHPTISIGSDARFSNGVHISAIENIAIGNQVLMGSNIYISDHNHGVYRGNTQSSPDEAPAHRTLGGGGPVTIGDNVWIGDNVVIIGPAAIGKGAIIGANSVLRGVVPANAIAVGAPAKVAKIYNEITYTWDNV